jgi:hypothetical protein
MMKWGTACVCAFSALLAASAASAEMMTFYDEDEMHEFVMELLEEDSWLTDGGEGGMLDSCTYYYPEVYTVSFYHTNTRPGHWHLHYDILCDDDDCYVCYNSHSMSNVEGVQMWHKTTESDACDWCSEGGSEWDVEYADWPIWPNCEDDDCWGVMNSDDVVYWGKEVTAYDDYDFNSTEEIGRFNDKWHGSYNVILQALDASPPCVE